MNDSAIFINSFYSQLKLWILMMLWILEVLYLYFADLNAELKKMFTSRTDNVIFFFGLKACISFSD